MVINNSILWGDGAEEINQYSDSTPIIRDSVVQGGCPVSAACTNVLSGSPRLGPLQNNGGPTQTHGLTLGSSAIDTGGVTVACPDTDQRGIPRPKDGNDDGKPACDIGAFEVETKLVSFTTYLPITLK